LLLLGPVYLWRELRFLSGFCLQPGKKPRQKNGRVVILHDIFLTPIGVKTAKKSFTVKDKQALAAIAGFEGKIIITVQ